MSEFLNSLNAPEKAEQSWAAEVAAAEATAPAPEPVAADPAPESAPAVEAVPDTPAPAAEATEEHDRRVPLKALQEERQKRAEYERELNEYKRRLSELEQRVPQTPAAPETPEPDPETDPIGALKHAREQLKAMQEETLRQRREAELNAIAYNSATQFSQQAPDYQDAYRYAINSRAQELAALGVDQRQIPAILKREEMSLIENTVTAGRDPAEAIYQFAKARGYAGRTAAPAPAPVTPAPVPPPSPALQQQKAAVAASASAGGAPAAKGELTDSEAVNLKGAAFDAYWNKRFGGNRSSMFRE